MMPRQDKRENIKKEVDVDTGMPDKEESQEKNLENKIGKDSFYEKSQSRHDITFYEKFKGLVKRIYRLWGEHADAHFN